MRLLVLLKTALGCSMLLLAMGKAQHTAAQVPKKAHPQAKAQPRPAARLPDSSLLQNLPPDAYTQVTGYVQRFREPYATLRRQRADYLAFSASLLAQAHLPDDFKILSLVESHVNPDAVSAAGAVGIWQLMPQMAQDHQLANGTFDERKDMYKSAQAAVRYLRTLYGSYPDRLLTVAAYNCGPGRVAAALKARPGGSFWAIREQLPAETQNHVLKYLAGVSIFYNLPPTRLVVRSAPVTRTAEPPPDNPFNRPREVAGTDYLTLQITASFQPAAIVTYTGVPADTFEQLNPQLRQCLIRQGACQLQLPRAYMVRFLAQKSLILQASLEAPPAQR